MQETDHPNPWTVLRTEEKFACSYFSVWSDTVRHGAGLPRAYNSVRMKTIGVAVAPIDDEGCTRFTWELPAGGCRLDQAPLEAATIELSEETGYRASHWLRLFDCAVSPGTIDGRTQCFVAWGLEVGAPHPEPEEQLVQRRVPFAEAISMALSGEISHFASVSLLLGIQIKCARNQLLSDLMSLLQKSA
jgi:ADP-ribose pyrophosphatase YjhB (NUDIX family)